MKFFCLNIHTATERRTHCREQFTRAGIDVEFVRALDTRMNHIRHQNANYKVGQLGCMLSHMRLIEEVGRHDISPAVIFEDDIRLVDGFRERLDEALLTLPDDWDLAFVGWWPEYFNYNQLRAKPVSEHWVRMTQGVLWGCHCYMVNGSRGADRALEILQPITGHVDDVLLRAIVECRIKGYFLREPLADQMGTFQSQTQG